MAADLKQIGRELNIRYILEGSVQRGGERMRVNAQLINAESGHHLWAERFDKPIADLFDMQDEIVARLSGALKTELVTAEGRRSEGTLDPDSVDLHFRALALLYLNITPENVAGARDLSDQALAADPGNVEALVTSANADAIAGTGLYASDPLPAIAAAESKLTKALHLVPNHARAHLLQGFIRILTKRAAEGIAECEHASLLNRNFAAAHALIGLGKIFIGRPEEAEADILDALRLSPRDSFAQIWMTHAATAKNQLGLWEQTIAWARRAIEANPNFFQPHCELALALAQLGRLDEARSAMKAGLAIMPNFTISRARAAWTARSDNPIFLARLEPLLESLGTIGVPD